MSLIKKPILIDSFVLGALSIFFIDRIWQKWAHPTWDFGREVYIPWQISQGEILYKDLAYMFGAFPPLWNALLFKLFGPSILTVALFNIFISLISAALIYRLSYELFDRFTALISTAVYLCLFAFSAHNSHNMYFVAPYTHSCFYALFFGICALNFIYTYFRNLDPKHLLFAGSCLGLMLLSRLEIFLAFFVPALVAFGLFISKHDAKSVPRLKSWIVFLSGITIPVALCLLYFLPYLPLNETIPLIIGYDPNWAAISCLMVYKNLAGYTEWQSNVTLIIKTVIIYLAVFTGLKVFCRLVTSTPLKNNNLFLGLSVIALTLLTAFALPKIGIRYGIEIFYGQAVLIVAMIVIPLKKLYDNAGSDKKWPEVCVILVLCFWALFLLLKVPLRSTPMSYGYFYCLPGVLASVLFVMGAVPKHFEERYGMGRHSKIFIGSFLLLICSIAQLNSLNFLRSKDYPIGEGINRIWTINISRLTIGSDVNKFLEWSKNNMQEDETFVAFPQGVMLNFLTKHRITGPHVTFMPAEMLSYGERSMLDPLILNPPDYFIFVNQDIRVNGNLTLGLNYGVDIVNWVNANYIPVWQTGTEFGYPGFGIKVLKRIQH